MGFFRSIKFFTFATLTCAAGTTNALTYRAVLVDPTNVHANSQAIGIWGTSIVGYTEGASHNRATLWRVGNPDSIDLQPAGYGYSQAHSAFGDQQVGMAHKNNLQHAMLWNGTAASPIDLHPNGFESSSASALTATRQAGWASLPNQPSHAIIWKGSPDDYVDIHPPGFQASSIYAMTEDVQAGAGQQAPAYNRQAMLWRGTANSAINLHPPGFIESNVNAVVGDMQIGSGFDTSRRALLWKGTAESVVDITPLGYSGTLALSGSTAGQVGYGWGAATGDEYHALYWNGTADSAINLHHSLEEIPIAFIESVAMGINDDGTIVGYARDGAFRDYAMKWEPIPEPKSLGLAAIAIVFLRIRPSKPPSSATICQFVRRSN